MISWVGSTGIDRVRHLTPFLKFEFVSKPLPNCLRDLNEMTTLYISDQVLVPKYDAFGKYMTVSPLMRSESKTNYVARDLKVSYDEDSSHSPASVKEIAID